MPRLLLCLIAFLSPCSPQDPAAKLQIVSPKNDGIVATAINSRGDMIGFEWQEDKVHRDVIGQEPFYLRDKAQIFLPLLKGYTATNPMALSDTGLVVGRASKPHPPHERVHLADQAFVWQEKTGIEGIGALEGDSGSAATGVTSDGNRLSGYSSGGDHIRACIWERDGAKWKGTALPQKGNLRSFVVPMSNDGKLVAGLDAYEPCLWTRGADGTWTREKIGEAGSFAPRAVNNAGTVVGLQFTGDGLTHAVIWTRATGIKKLEKPKGYVKSEALAINNEGDVVGMIDGPNGSEIGPKGFVYEKGILRPIDEAGPNFTSATAINDKKQVAGVMEKPEEKAPDARGQVPKDKS
jgi:uncharacterized membrane protein